MASLRVLTTFIPSRQFLKFRTYKKCTLMALTVICLVMFSSLQKVMNANRSAYVFEEPFRKLGAFLPVLKVLRDLNITIVLLDADVLRFNDTDPIIGAPNVVTFGVFENDSARLQSTNFWRELRPQWWFTEAVGTDYRRLAIKEENTVYVSASTHYFFVSPTALVHIAVIYRRNNYFWVAGMKESLFPSRYKYLSNFTYSIPLPMAVELFNCSYAPMLTSTRGDFNVCIPEDTEFYLWQIPYAKFYECHFEDVVYPFKRQYKMNEQDTSPQREALEEVVRISKELRLPTMIIFGTLLGWYRQCDYIVESMDMDVAMMQHEYKKELFDRVFHSQVLSMYRRLGTLDMGLEFRTHSGRWVWLDIFLMYPRTHNTSYTYMLNVKHFMRSRYPIKSGVCSAELLGLLVFLPCNYDEFIKSEYGTDGWFAPVGGHPHRNMELQELYEEKEIVYLEHIYSSTNCSRPSELWGCDEPPAAIVNSSLWQNDTRLGRA